MSSDVCEGFHFRSIREEDYAPIKKLHEELFPVIYENDYYTTACKGIGLFDRSMETIVAEDIGSHEIAGFIFFQFLKCNECEDEDLFLSEPLEVAYILIFGVSPKYQRRKLGTILMNRCMTKSAENSACGAVHLHVIDYNDKAINFYKNKDFQLLRTVPQFYDINGKLFDALLFIKYLNGYRSPVIRPLIDLAMQWFQSISNIIYNNTETA